MLEGTLQLAAGELFQPVGHDGHAVQEKGESSQKCKHRKNVHTIRWRAPLAPPLLSDFRRNVRVIPIPYPQFQNKPFFQ